MKKLALSVVCLALLVFVNGDVLGQGGGGEFNTAFSVQNLGEVPANLEVQFYDAQGDLTNTLLPDTVDKRIGAGENFTFDQRLATGNPDPAGLSFVGTARVESDQPIGGVVNIVRSGGLIPSFESYNAFDAFEVGTDILLPQILKQVSSLGAIYNTTIVIQNIDTRTANVTIIFRPDPIINAMQGGTLTELYTHTLSIPPLGQVCLDQSSTPNAAQIGEVFFGSARIIADRMVAPVVLADGGGQQLFSFPSYASGTVFPIILPSVYKEIPSYGDNYSTAMLIVNLGDQDAEVEIEYLPTSDPLWPATVEGTDIVTVTAKGALNVDQRYPEGASSIKSAQFMGAAKVQSLNGQQIAIMTNLRGGTRYGMTYGGLMTGGTTGYVPISYKEIQSGGYSWSSTIIVYNLESNVGDATVKFTFYPSGRDPFEDPNEYTVTDIRQFDLRYATVVSGSTSYLGSVKVESVGSTPRPLGILVQTRGVLGTGDALMAFLGVDKP
jgi:hypothetical protein